MLFSLRLHAGILLVLLGSSSFMACREATTPMPTSSRMFYFDALVLSGAGKMYVYEPVKDPLHPLEIWHKRFTGDYHASTLYKIQYTPDGAVQQAVVESIDKKGVTLTKLELSYPFGDSIRALSARINEANSFFFGQPDTAQIARYQIEYREPTDDSVRVILTRERRFVQDESYTYKGKDYPALRYRVNETLETETEGFTESIWQTTEIYALGLGLVYYRKPVNSDFVLEYRLKDVVPFENYTFD